MNEDDKTKLNKWGVKKFKSKNFFIIGIFSLDLWHRLYSRVKSVRIAKDINHPLFSGLWENSPGYIRELRDSSISILADHVYNVKRWAQHPMIGSPDRCTWEKKTGQH